MNIDWTDPTQADAAVIVGISAWVFVAALISGGIGAFIGHFRSRAAFGLFVGMLLGPLGWILTMFVKEGEREEGMLDAIMALVCAGVIIVFATGVAWKTFARPQIDRVNAEQRERMEAMWREKPELSGEAAYSVRDAGVVCGIVERATDYGLIVDTTDATAAAEPLLSATKDVLHVATWRPQAIASGSVFLAWHPRQRELDRGSKVNVIAVPLGYAAFGIHRLPAWTMNFDDPQWPKPGSPPVKSVHTPPASATPRQKTPREVAAEIERKYRAR